MALSATVHIRYVHGYLALDMVEEARAELALIPRVAWARLEVLEARIALHMAAREWELAAGFAQQLARRHPDVEQGWIHWAYSLRELQRVAEARAVLLEAEPMHGKTSAILQFNLGCYYCLLGELEAARERVGRACKLDTSCKKMALDDPDLAALWA